MGTTACSKEVMMKNKHYLLAFSHDDDKDDSESEIELGLGLSLGGSGGSRGGGVKFLTAQDLPSVVSSSTTTTHSSLRLSGRPTISGTKRAADSVARDAVVHHGSSSTSASQIVGWPPIRTYRMNNLASQTKSVNAEEGKIFSEENNEKNGDLVKKFNNGRIGKAGAPAPENSHLGFVKVNMDGVRIGRKIDLNAHSCYETLAQMIEDMFFRPSTSITSIRGEKERIGKASKLLNGLSEFVLTYEDKEGDWMLVGDVPWRMFLSNVRRLRIMRTSEANGLGPGFQERNDVLRSKPI